MNHAEAVGQMATERYLLGELSPELRDAFEEHFFECPECAMDVRAAALFIDEAKEQLPELTGPLAVPSAERQPAAVKEKKSAWWSTLLRPALAAPVFAALIAVVGYQNIVTLPALRVAASEPQLAPTVYLHDGTRGAEGPIAIDPKHGIVLTVDRPQQA
ncbi:MAG TPA: zf-HC2 domain-containing protein, partial [Acidobacteriaceae bacterium]